MVEPFGTACLEGGHYHAGGNEYCAVGRYELEGGKLICEVTLFDQGQTHTLFGRTAARHTLHYEGVVSGDRITGYAKDEEGNFLVQYRATKFADLWLTYFPINPF